MKYLPLKHAPVGFGIYSLRLASKSKYGLLWYVDYLLGYFTTLYQIIQRITAQKQLQKWYYKLARKLKRS
jgi:hypothetical protein